MLTSDTRGVLPIAPTPFFDDGRIDTASIDRLMDFKGLMGAMGKPKGPVAPAPKEEAEEVETGGSAMEFFKLASEASASGDHEAAASAFKSGVEACYSGKE